MDVREVLVADAREVLAAERARAVRRAAALGREFAQLAEAASAGGTDDEHDPEGATLAFERQHTAALLEQAREQVAAIDAALSRARRRPLRPLRPVRAAHRGRPAGGPPGRADLRPLRRRIGRPATWIRPTRLDTCWPTWAGLVGWADRLG